MPADIGTHMASSGSDDRLHLYWGTGCTSCLRAKEFLERNDVAYVSHNIFEDDDALDELAARGLPRHVPIITKGETWTDAKDLSDVAAIAGVEYAADPLPVETLHDRLQLVLDATQRFLEQLPEGELATDIPNRPRSYADLVFHIFTIPESFVRHESGVRIDAHRDAPRWDHHSKSALRNFGLDVQERIEVWFEGPGRSIDWSERAEVYWGRPTKHEFFERTTWHAGQHARQLQWVLEHELGLAPDGRLGEDVWEGLPMPEKIWDAQN